MNDIIGIGQFGDVHIGICAVAQPLNSKQENSNNSSHQSDNELKSTNENDQERNIIHVAVKTCKADADLLTSENFLEEACKFSKWRQSNL